MNVDGWSLEEIRRWLGHTSKETTAAAPQRWSAGRCSTAKTHRYHPPASE